MHVGMAKWMAAAAVAACLCATVAPAQMNAMDHGSKPAATGADMAGKSLDDILSIYEKNIVGAAEAMPADKFDFAPAQANFMSGFKVDFESPKPVASFSAQVKHVASANYYFYGAGGMKPDVDVKAIGDLKSKDQIVAALKQSFAFAHKAVSSMTAANAFEPIDSGGHKSTRNASYAFGLAHMGDHYGQLVEYLRMNGIIPPASRKTTAD